ncbi:RmlC-like cupin domain-containing protein [Hyaloraphidium curvatum]|nr:RmlC-like cupin domain-containing protein [Hyaloraphidium curvatum]
MTRTPTFTLRPSATRGHANHGWLDTYHTFSFANYYDKAYTSFGSLRVLNEDHVEPMEGFGTHGHSRFDIFSYVYSGELEHRDSLGTREIIPRGGVQMTHTSTGIRHSEYNVSPSTPVRFLQLWAEPRIKVPKPGYQTGHFPDSVKENKLALIVAPDDFDPAKAPAGQEAPIKIHADLYMEATLLDPGKAVEHQAFGDAGRRLYVHNVMTGDSKVKIEHDSGQTLTLAKGDGAFVTDFNGKLRIENVGDVRAEVVVLDLE